MKINKILYYLRIFFVFVGSAFLIASIVLSLLKNSELSSLFLFIASICGFVGLILIIIYDIFITGRNIQSTKMHYSKNVIETAKSVDVKDLPKSRQEKLYGEYENLYKMGLIDKEDLEKKRIELLGK